MVVYVLGVLQGIYLTVPLRARPTVGIARVDVRVVRVAVYVVGLDIQKALFAVKSDCGLVLRPHYFGSGDQP